MQIALAASAMVAHPPRFDWRRGRRIKSNECKVSNVIVRFLKRLDQFPSRRLLGQVASERPVQSPTRLRFFPATQLRLPGTARLPFVPRMILAIISERNPMLD